MSSFEVNPSIESLKKAAKEYEESWRLEGEKRVEAEGQSFGMEEDDQGRVVKKAPGIPSVTLPSFDAIRLHGSRDDVPERHPNSARFHELLEEAGIMHDRKQADYGADNDPFANVRASEEWGIPPWVGALVRLNDKVTRLKSFARKGVLANESAKDSMMDIAVYALIAYCLYEETEGA